MIETPYSAYIPHGEEWFEGPVLHLEPHDTQAIEDETYTKELIDGMRNIERGSYALLPDAFDEEVMYSPGPTAVFNEIADLGRGRTNSVHEVAFGQLLVSSMFGDERTELVGVKPFKMPREVAKEFSLSRYFSGANGVTHPFRTFTPLGVMRRNDGSFGMITKYEHGVRSLDNVFENPEIDDESPIIARAIGRCAALLASMHAEGLAHGDAQTKNMFVSNYQELFLADLESIESFAVQESQADRRIQGDLVTIIRSIASKRQDLLIDKPELFDIHFGLVYESIARSPHSQVPESARKTQADLRDIFRDPFSVAA